MPFDRFRSANLPWRRLIQYENAALAVVTAGVAGLYALALSQAFAPLVPDRAAISAQDAPASMAKAPLLLGRVSAPVPEIKSLLQPGKLATLDLEAVRAGDDTVPRLVAAALPADLPVVRDVAARKASFFSAVLPLVLLVNEEILAERQRLEALHAKHLAGDRLSLADNAWLAGLANKYAVDEVDFAVLLRRVDAVSPALTLAQAAEESGWGRSRFAQEGNALFGQRTWVRGAGIVPAGRGKGQRYEVRAFTTLLDSVRAYARNLNTHRSYADLRQLRATMRRAGNVDPSVLATALLSYSERGEAYVDNLQAIIRANSLTGFEKAKLAPPRRPTQIANRPIR